MVSDGGHDVAEVQGSDAATFLLVLLCKSLAGMLQLQLLQKHTHINTEDTRNRSAEKRSKECVPVMRSNVP